MYNTYLDIGNSPLDFWELTYGEAYSIIEAYNNRRIGEQREKYICIYKLADLIAVAVAAVLDGKNKYPKLEEAFPGLFDNLDIEEKRAEAEIKAYKAKFLDFVYKHNERRRKNDTGRIGSTDNSTDL